MKPSLDSQRATRSTLQSSIAICCAPMTTFTQHTTTTPANRQLARIAVSAPHRACVCHYRSVFVTSGDGEPFTPTEGQLYAAALPKGHRRLELINRGTCAQIALDCARATRSRKVFVTTKHLVNSPMPRSFRKSTNGRKRTKSHGLLRTSTTFCARSQIHRAVGFVDPPAA